MLILRVPWPDSMPAEVIANTLFGRHAKDCYVEVEALRKSIYAYSEVSPETKNDLWAALRPFLQEKDIVRLEELGESLYHISRLMCDKEEMSFLHWHIMTAEDIIVVLAPGSQEH